jgi:hypothetical protein
MDLLHIATICANAPRHVETKGNPIEQFCKRDMEIAKLIIQLKYVSDRVIFRISTI